MAKARPFKAVEGRKYGHETTKMDRKPKFLSYGATLERVELRYPFLWHLAAFNTLPSYCRLSLNEVY